MSLTELAIKNFPPPERGQKVYWDASLPGFGVRVSQGGSRTFILLDPREKSRVRETIGRYPLLSLSDARGEAKRRLAEATLGKRRGPVVDYAAAVEEFLGVIEKKRRARTHKEYKRVMDRHLKFSGKIGDLKPWEVEKRILKIKSVNEQGMAFGTGRAFFNWAKRKRYLSESPLQMENPYTYKPRSRVLSDDELRRVWLACEDDTFGRIIKTLILTGQREGEIARLSDNMVGQDRVYLPEWLTKNGKAHTVPLGSLARSIIPTATGLLFRGPSGHFKSFARGKALLDERSGVTGWRIHDLRRTFRTNLGRLGVRPDIAERLVNHVGAQSDMERVYDVYSYFPEMKEAIEKWEAHIRGLVADDASCNVRRLNHRPVRLAQRAVAA
jgi:integrase